MTLTYPRVKPLTRERAEELGADPRRQRLFDQILSASTLEEVTAATLAQHAWLVASPDDFAVLEAGELLAYLEEDLAGPEVPDAVSAAAPTSEQHVRDTVNSAGVKPRS